AEQRARGGKGRGGAGERMADRRETPHDDRRGKAAAHTHVIEPPSREKEAECVNKRERVDHGRVLRLGPVELELQRRREDAQDLPIHVVDRRDSKQQGANRPAVAEPGWSERRRHSVTPSFQMAISRYPCFSLLASARPDATSRISVNKSSASWSIVAAPPSNAPASKSIQWGFFAAIAVLEETLSVGTGNPSGVPRPVVKRSTVAPLATRAVDDTPSFPGASSSASPPARVAVGSP